MGILAPFTKPRLFECFYNLLRFLRVSHRVFPVLGLLDPLLRIFERLPHMTEVLLLRQQHLRAVLFSATAGGQYRTHISSVYCIF